VIFSALKKRYPDHDIVNVTGVRRQESTARSKMPVAASVAATAQASRFMRVGIYDEAQTLYGPVDKTFAMFKQLHVQEVRLNLYWGGKYGVAKSRPASATNPADPAYDWDLYDRTVNFAAQDGVHVLFSIYGTPSWANGGRGPNVAPTRATDLRNFAFAADIFFVNGVPIVDVTRCSTYADRRHRWLFDVFRRAEELREIRDELEDEGREAIRRLVADLTRYMELAREMPTGELLYQFLADSGWLTRMSKAATARDEAEVQNISKFFRRIQEASRALRYDNVRELVVHLDALMEAGEDPAVAEADVETPAVHVLTIHKAKGLEFPVVFLVSLVQDKFPTRRRGDRLEVPPELIRSTLPSGDFHLQEERRLFYVGMTRARRELHLTSARDYGTARSRKVSQFILEALDLPSDAARPFTAKAIEEIAHNAPAPDGSALDLPRLAPDDELLISHKQIDDYQTCPFKYRYVHVLRVPIRRHHAVAYGSTIHKVIEYYLLRRVAGNYTALEDLLAVYEREWENEGFLTWEHQEARKTVGRDTLTRFWHEEESAGARPTHVEKDFGFNLGPDRVRGRFDRVDEDLLGATIVDYKTGEVRDQRTADRRVKETLQLKIYALAWREMNGVLPQRVELRFVESQRTGSHAPDTSDIEEAVAAVKAAAAGIRARAFEATPSQKACRFCAYNQICPYTATRE